MSTPWELHTGEKLDLKQSPLVKYGTVAVFHQPVSLRTKKHPFRGGIGVFVGTNMLSPKAYDVYIPSLGTMVQRGSNYRVIDHVPESWKWKDNPRLAELKLMSRLSSMVDREQSTNRYDVLDVEKEISVMYEGGDDTDDDN